VVHVSSGIFADVTSQRFHFTKARIPVNTPPISC
jgi:hypothetical protein